MFQTRCFFVAEFFETHKSQKGATYHKAISHNDRKKIRYLVAKCNQNQTKKLQHNVQHEQFQASETFSILPPQKSHHSQTNYQHYYKTGIKGT